MTEQMQARGINLLFEDIIQLDLLAHQLEVARKIVTDAKEQEGTFPYFKSILPELETRVIGEYKKIRDKLDGITCSESGIVRIALRSIIKSCYCKPQEE